MADVKTQVNGHAPTSPVRGLVGQAAEVTGDIIELAEMQLQLAKADATDAMKIAVRPILFVGIGGVLMLASFPILLLAIAGLLARYSGLPSEIAQLTVGLVAATIAVLIAYLSLHGLRSALTPFSRSAEEFKQNLLWLKRIFRTKNL